MVSYPDLGNLSSSSTIGNLLALPNSSYPYFWGWILGGIWMIIALSLYFSEKLRIGKGRGLSSIAVSSFAIIILATIGTIVGFITLEIEIYILVIGFLFIGIWIFMNS